MVCAPNSFAHWRIICKSTRLSETTTPPSKPQCHLDLCLVNRVIHKKAYGQKGLWDSLAVVSDATSTESAPQQRWHAVNLRTGWL